MSDRKWGERGIVGRRCRRIATPLPFGLFVFIIIVVVSPWGSFAFFASERQCRKTSLHRVCVQRKSKRRGPASHHYPVILYLGFHFRHFVSLQVRGRSARQVGKGPRLVDLPPASGWRNARLFRENPTAKLSLASQFCPRASKNTLCCELDLGRARKWVLRVVNVYVPTFGRGKRTGRQGGKEGEVAS